jgi:hypothetical protein
MRGFDDPWRGSGPKACGSLRRSVGFGIFLVYLSLSFIRPFEIVTGLAQYSPMAVVGGAALLASLLDRALSGSPVLPSPQLFLVGALVAWGMFSIVAAQGWLGGAAQALDSLSASLLLFYLVLLDVDSVKRLRVTLRALVALVVLVSAEGILAYYAGHRADELTMEDRVDLVSGGSNLSGLLQESAGVVRRIRSRGFLNDPNDLAQALVAVLPFAFALRRRAAAANTFQTWIPAAVLLVAVVLTRSRGGLLALLVLLFLVLRDRVSAALSTAVAGAGGLVFIALGILGGRAAGMDESAQLRTEAWYAGWEMLKSSPIWGVGFGFFTEYHERVAHNSYVQCLAELGLVGYFLWLGLLLWTLRSVYALASLRCDTALDAELVQFARAALYSLVSFLVGAFFLSRTYSTMLFLLIGLATAAAEVGRRRRLLTVRFRPAVWALESAAGVALTVVGLYLLGRVVW